MAETDVDPKTPPVTRGQSPRHYVIVVHGTWNSPDGLTTKWYEPGGTFTSNLAKLFDHGPLAGSLFREIDGQRFVFSWSGENTDAARSEAASRLANALIAIRRRDPDAVFDFVSHSHGGNVTLKALQIYFEALYKQARLVGENFIGVLENNPEVPEEERNDAMVHALSKAVFYEFPSGTDEFLRSRGSTLMLAEQLLRPVVSAFLARHAHASKSRFGLSRRNRNFREGLMRLAGDRIAIPWCSYSDSHRIGRLVFLGTPFLQKRWRVALYRRWLVSAALGVALLSAATHYILVALLSATSALLPGVSFIGLNPLSWPGWVLTLFIPIAALATGFILMVGPPIPARSDVNFYFDIQNSPLRLDGRHTKLDCLVISAEQYDEALLAVSSEPLLHSHLMPRIESILRPAIKPAKRAQPAGVNRTSMMEWASSIGAYPFHLVNTALTLCGNLCLRALSPLLLPFLKETLGRAISSAASGLPPEEFREAYLRVTSDIREPMIFTEHKWDVSHMLATRNTETAVHQKRDPKAYEYLWSFDALESRVNASPLWKDLIPRLDELLARFPPNERSREAQRLASTCLTMEEKFREFSGMIELGHSQYYGDPEVIAAIAAFLETGRLPVFADAA